MKIRTGALRALCVGVLATLLVSCGGEELVPFSPARLIVFGDEASVLVAGATPATARKYTINYVNVDTGVVDCAFNLIWTQVLAATYNISFRECPFPADAAQVGYIRALAGATAGGTADIDLTAQITRQLALPADDGGGINSTDLVSVYIGVNDVVVVFVRYKAGLITFDEAIAEAEAAGETLAVQINRIANAGGKVITATVPDVSVTPYGRSQTVDDAARLLALTERINARMLVNIDNDGRKIGLIEINPYVAAVVGNPTVYGYLEVGVREAACLPADVLLCTSKTLQADANQYAPFNFLWADSLQLSPAGHAQLGSLAASRALNQPF
jgi:outer membrane lipase/esterase